MPVRTCGYHRYFSSQYINEHAIGFKLPKTIKQIAKAKDKQCQMITMIELKGEY